MLLTIALTGLFFLRNFLAGPPDYSGTGFGQTTVTVVTGDTLASIGNHLKQAGVVASVDAFISAANANPLSASIQPGRYVLPKQCSSSHALEVLLSRNTHTSTAVVIPEGARTSEVIDKIVDQTDISRLALMKEIKNPQYLGLPSWANNNVEGFLFPASYEVDGNSTARSVLRAMVAKALQEHSALNLSTEAKKTGFSAYDILTMASIIEKEVQQSDFLKVARVLHNRLAINMPLQVDSTVAYGLNVGNPLLSQAQLDKDTPYNSYRRTGLPPTPIGNPGSQAINAALHPGVGDWLYFVTVDLKLGTTKFASTYEEFLQYKDELIRYCQENREVCN